MQTYKPYSGPSLALRTDRSRRPGRGGAPSAEARCAVSPQMLQNFEQMLVNEALVATIFQIVDHLGQDLRALRSDIAMFHERPPGCHADLRGRVDAALGKLDRAIDSVGQIGAGQFPDQLV